MENKMDIRCVVNKKSVKKNKALKNAQKSARKYYQEKLFDRASGVTKTKLRKLADLSQVQYKRISDIELSNQTEAVKLSKEALIELCKKGGLTGRSGNGFEVAKKLEAFPKSGGTLLINGAECDPGLVTDSWLYRKKQNFILQGALTMQHALSLDKVILATKEPLQDIKGIQQVKVPDRFPIGYEKYLITQVLGVTLNADELPQSKGILVMNLQTVIAIAELLQDLQAGVYKYITVANLLTAEAKVARVHIGDSAEEVAAKCFSQSAISGNTLYVGGGALNCHKAKKGELIQDTTGYIAIGNMPNYADAGKCKGCGACTRNCPAGVQVHKLVQHVEKEGTNTGNACKDFHPTACIGCGSCTYGCMAGKDVRAMVAQAKMGLS